MESCVFAVIFFVVGMAVGMIMLWVYQLFNPPKAKGMKLSPGWKPEGDDDA